MIKTGRLRKFVAGNWKMHGTGGHLDDVQALAEFLDEQPAPPRVAIFPPAPLLHRMATLLEGSPIEVGGQDVHHASAGAHTGDVSAAMLQDAGATLVILGHSERRTGHGETNAQIAAKFEQAVQARLEPIVCVGETWAERSEGRALQVVRDQVSQSLPASAQGYPFCVAYEPVWAIGGGGTPTPWEIDTMHAAIRSVLIERFGISGASPPILYGGSVVPANAGEILDRRAVSGALVGGASLRRDDFLQIIGSAADRSPACCLTGPLMA